MITHSRVYSITTTPFVIDLSLLADGDVNNGSLVGSIADFCLECDANTAIATIKAKGANTSAAYKTITDGTFAISGGMVKVEGMQISSFEVTCAGTLPFPIRVTRKIGS